MNESMSSSPKWQDKSEDVRVRYIAADPQVARIGDWLQRSGANVIMDFLRVEANMSVWVNGRYPRRVVAEGKNPFTGKVQPYLGPDI
ncbi:MAG: hypothetical protein WA979_04925 [Pacificimonas sp.]